MRLYNTGIMLILIINIFLFSFSVADKASEYKEKEVYRIGISSQSFGNINANDATAAIKAWASTITKEQNLKVNFDVRLLFDSTEDILKSIMNVEYDGYSVSLPEFYEMHIAFPEYVYILKKQKSISLNYIIITQSKNGVITPQDLLRCKLITCNNNQMVMSCQWLESILYNYTKGKRIKRPELAENFSKAILQVFFRQVDAAIVTREAFDIACELNPQLKKEIKIIYESQPLVSGFFLILQPTGGKKYEILEKIILDVKKTPGGRQVLNIFQSTSIEKFPSTVLEDTVKFLKKYEQLKEKSESMWIEP
jgi:hypothetical protein